MTQSKLIAGALCVGLVLAAAGTAALAQSAAADNLVIYAKAGRVNLVTGCVHLRAAGSDAVKPLSASDELAAGDLVVTGTGAKLEILLSPGSYLRLAENAEIKMVATDLEDVRLILRRGSAVVETGGPDDSFRVQVAMPSGTAVIDKRGLYRLNVDGKRSELLVRAGATIIQPAAIKVGDGKRVAITGTVSESVAKFDKNATHDALDDWSQERAESLANANGSLSRTELARAVRGPGPGTNSSGGSWVYSPRLGYSVFVPADQGRAASPYGFLYPIGSGGGWSVNNNPVARGLGDGPAPAVTPAGTRGSNQTPGRP
jgi:hypothetical protein